MRPEPELLNVLPRVGVYTLLIQLLNGIHIKVGMLGERRFSKGYYAYTGSALGRGSSLRKRVARHLQKEKLKFWHIDYLLGAKDSAVMAVMAVQTKRRLECEIVGLLKSKLKIRIPVLGFGASDCDQGCGSHLLLLEDECTTQRIYSIYREDCGSRVLAIDLQQNSKIYLD